MGADIAADEHIHDVVTNAQFPFVQPDLDVENTVQLIGFCDDGIHSFLIVGKLHPHNGPGIGGPWRTFALALSRTMPLWVRYMPILGALSWALASFSQESMEGLVFLLIF